MSPDSTSFQDWLEKANDDLAYARSIFKAKDAAAWGVGFHAHQMVEKILKGFLVSQDRDFPKIHQLDRLLELCAETDSSFHGLSDIIQPLDSYYIEQRYPADMPEYTWKEVEGALRSAEEIKEFVLEKLKA